MIRIPYLRNGLEVTREEFDRTARRSVAKRQRKAKSSGPAITKTYSEARPWKSLALSCNPSLIPERNKMLQEAGIIGAYYDPNEPIDNFKATSRKARRAAMKLFHVHDEDGGYGDG